MGIGDEANEEDLAATPRVPFDAGSAEDSGDDDEDEVSVAAAAAAAAGDDANDRCASDDVAAEARPDDARVERAGGGGVDEELVGERALALPLGRSRSGDFTSGSDLMGALDGTNALTGVLGADTFFNVDSIVWWFGGNAYAVSIPGEWNAERHGDRMQCDHSEYTSCASDAAKSRKY